ncbi:MAG: dockerin type I domain-containing protein [Pirellulaceae bacterium]
MQRSDVSGDNRITAIDALMVINYLNPSIPVEFSRWVLA